MEPCDMRCNRKHCGRLGRGTCIGAREPDCTSTGVESQDLIVVCRTLFKVPSHTSLGASIGFISSLDSLPYLTSSHGNQCPSICPGHTYFVPLSKMTSLALQNA
jgi:hypothetical protein